MKTLREDAHAELQRAMTALEDGSGHETWGPGPVGEILWKRAAVWRAWLVPGHPGSEHAARAFDGAAEIICKTWWEHAHGTVTIEGNGGQAAFIAAMRKLAPVLLDIRLDAQGIE